MCDRKSFDDLVELFKTDPEGFERYKQEQVQDCINEICADCPDKRERCLQFQWTLDHKLNKYKNPIARYNAMVSMFWDQVEEFKHANQTLEVIQSAKENATILEFKPKK